MGIVFEDSFTGASSDVELSTTPPDTLPVSGGVWNQILDDAPFGGFANLNIDDSEGDISPSLNNNGGGLIYLGEVSTGADLTTADYDVEIDVASMWTGAAYPIFMIARYVDNNNFFAVRIDNDINDESIELFRYVSGTATLLGTKYTIPSAANHNYIFELRINGSTTDMVVYVDGVSRITASDNSFQGAGRAGLGAGRAMGEFAFLHSTIEIDYFKITEAGSAPAYTLIGSAGLGIASNSSMNVRRSFTGSGSLGITSASSLSIARSLVGFASLEFTAFSGMSVIRSLLGSGVLGQSSASVMSFGGAQSIIGSTILSLTGTAQSNVNLALAGVSTFSLFSSSAMSVSRVASGGATFGLNSNSQMSVGRSIVGSSGLRVASNSALNFIANKSINGSANIGLATSTPMSVHRALIGSATFELSSASVFGFMSSQRVKLAALAISDAALNEIMITETLAVNCTLKEKLANKITITEEVL